MKVAEGFSCSQYILPRGTRAMGIKGAKPEPEPEPEPPHQPILDCEWRKVDWNNKDTLLTRAKEYQPRNGAGIKHVRILLHGPVGAGKSSFINSVNSIFQDRMAHDAHVDQTGGTSYTRKKQTHTIQKGENFYPFVFNDIMGLSGPGVHEDDIKLVLKGHVKDDYTFNTAAAMSDRDLYYNKEPFPEDKTHVLVCVIPADTTTLPTEVTDQIRHVRLAASDLGIPQICIFTKIDLADPLMERNVKEVYKMKNVRKKMQEFGDIVGIPMNCMFPVKNYHEEVDLENDMDVLILKALQQMLDFGEDFINKKCKV